MSRICVHRSRLVTGIAAVAFLLLGCSGPDHDAQVAPTPAASASPSAPSSPSPAPSPSPTPSPASTQEPEPQPGPDFERDDEIGAQAAAKYFLQLYGYMIRTGDVTRFSAISWFDTCRFCRNALETVREVHSKAAVVEGTELSVEILTVYAFDEVGGGFPLDIRATETEGRSYDASGNLIHTENEESYESRIELLHDGSSWRLLNLVKLSDIK